MAFLLNNDLIRINNKRLLHYLIRDWKRISTRLLHISNDISYLDLFWRSGFDMTHLLEKEKSILEYHTILGPKVEIIQANKHDIPCSDESFEYVVLLYCYQNPESFQKILNEAFRIASKGLIILDWNRLSLAGFTHQNFAKPSQIANSIKEIIPNAHYFAYSCLHGPAFTWKNTTLCKTLNKRIIPLTIGAVQGYRIDFNLFAPTTNSLFNTEKVLQKIQLEPSRANLDQVKINKAN